MAESIVNRNEAVTQPQDSRVKKWGRRVLAVAGGATVASLFGIGGNLMLKNNNMDDFNDLKAFTSPEHQDDRCNTQAAFNAQDKMRQFFAEKGGVTDAEADLMAGVVGLEPAEIKGLLDNELFPMDYDCEVAEASSSQVTKGLAAVAVGAGILVGATGTGVYVAMRPGRKNTAKADADGEELV